MHKLHFIFGYRSRFDLANKMFCGPAEDLLADLARQLEFTYTHSYADDAIIPPATHYVLAGEKAWALFGKSARDIGVVFTVGTSRYVCSYHPQDAADVRNIEAAFSGLDEDDDDTDAGTGKDSAVTNRANYRFWLLIHIEKLVSPLPSPPPFYQKTQRLDYCGFPESTYLYLDIETHPPTNTLQCLSVAFDAGAIYSFTVYNYKGELQPGALESLVWLIRAFQRYTVVAHNIGFDLPFLAIYHKILYAQTCHDTMLIWHRMFPEADKSLAHVIQALTNLPYHKDEAGTFCPHNFAQQSQLLAYNARDVYALREVHQAMLPLSPSASSVCDLIPHYIFAGLQGFYINDAKLIVHKRRLTLNDVQLTRMFRILTGNPTFNPNSNKQVAEWLYEGLQYAIVDTTKSGAPATDATTLYKLLSIHPKNLALQVLLEIKENSKRLSSLGYNPYMQLDSR